jgi:yecA family protein
VSSLSKRYRSGRPDPGELMPPNPRTFGAATFGAPQRARLSALLREAGWPREHMDVAELEGYLVALIAWPVSISSGAWLPLIWGERGWKVPTKIWAQADYEEFVTLIMGFLQDLERQLSSRPSRFEASVLREGGHPKVLHHWGRGFLMALTLDAQGLKWRSASARSAVETIASVTSSSATFRSDAVDEVVSAVLALMEQRASRGPLGPLEAVTLLDSATHASDIRSHA